MTAEETVELIDALRKRGFVVQISGEDHIYVRVSTDNDDLSFDLFASTVPECMLAVARHVHQHALDTLAALQEHIDRYPLPGNDQPS